MKAQAMRAGDDQAVNADMRNRARSAGPADVLARLAAPATIEVRADGGLLAFAQGQCYALGDFDADILDPIKALRGGVPLAPVVKSRRKLDQEIVRLIKALARRGLIEYRLRHEHKGTDLLAIEPQTPDYWPRARKFDATEAVVLSRFAFIRRRGSDMVLESPLALARFRLGTPEIAAFLMSLAQPRSVKELQRGADFPGLACLELLREDRILFTVDGVERTLRHAEGDDALSLWDFHDLLFHSRSTEGRHRDPIGATYPHSGVVAPLPAVRPSWSGSRMDLESAADGEPADAGLAALLRARRSTRDFDHARPITRAELARFLDRTARILSLAGAQHGIDDGGHAMRPYPSAGASYELELYLAVERCTGLDHGFYHYDARAHALTKIEAAASDFEMLFAAATQAMGVETKPQIVITIAARFGRVSWKYSSIAYSLILKNVGVLMQNFYLAATDMGLGGCAIGIANIELFARMTGLELHSEGPVGQFALGRGAA